MFRWPYFIISRLGTIAVLGYLAWMAWDYLGPRKPDTGLARQEIADIIIPDIVQDIRTARNDLDRIALLYFSNDHSDYFTEKLRASLERSGIADMRDLTAMEKARNLLNLSHPQYDTLNNAVKRGKNLDVQAVIFGRIHAFESYAENTRIDVMVHLAEVDTGQEVFSKRYTLEKPASELAIQDIVDKASSFPWLQRLTAWVLIILLLPVFSISFIRTMVARKSNLTNAAVLGVYTLAGALSGWLLLGAALTSKLMLLIFFPALGLIFVYNIWIMTCAVRLEEA